MDCQDDSLLRVGAVVRAPTVDLPMTVESIETEAACATCVWFELDRPRREIFPLSVLIPSEPLCSTKDVYMVADVPYNTIGPNVPRETYSREAKIRRTTRALYELWRSWSEDRGNIVLPWEECVWHSDLFDRVRKYADTGEWQPFPNHSWSRPDRLVGYDKDKDEMLWGPKPAEQVTDEAAFQALLRHVTSEMLRIDSQAYAP